MVLIVFRYQVKWKVVFYCKLLTFLTNCQIDKPMVCFLATDLSAVLWDPMRRFIKDDLLCETTKIEKLMLMGVEDKSNQNSYKKIDVGFCTESALRNAQNVHADVQNAFFDLVEILLVLLYMARHLQSGDILSTKKLKQRTCESTLWQLNVSFVMTQRQLVEFSGLQREIMNRRLHFR